MSKFLFLLRLAVTQQFFTNSRILSVEIHTVVFLRMYCRCLKILPKKNMAEKISSKEALKTCLSSDKFKAYLAEILPSLRLVILFVIGKGVCEWNALRNTLDMLYNLCCFVQVSTETRNLCLKVPVKTQSLQGFTQLNCDFEKKSKAVIGKFFKLLQF